MPATATITRTTYTTADSITPTMFNSQSCVTVTVPDALAGTEGVVRLAGDLAGTGSSAASPQLTVTGATAGTYADANDNVPQITVDAKGRITAVANRALVLPNSGAVGGTYASTALNIPQVEVDTKGRIVSIANRDLATLILGHVRSALYPVGEILITHRAGNPNTWLGFGTWTAYAAGKVLVGLDTGDATCDAIDDTGGSKTHTLAEANLPAHTHFIPHLSGTTDAAGGHSHTVPLAVSYSGGGSARDADPGSATNQAPVSTSPIAAHTHTFTTETGTTDAGNGTATAINHLPPFTTVAMWLRTA